MSTTRILFVNHSLGMGGIETMIVDLARLLPNEQFSAEVAVFEGGGTLEKTLIERGIPVHRLQKRAGIDFRLLLRLRRLLKERNIGVVHSHNFSAWLYSSLAARSLGNIVHVHTEHSGVGTMQRRHVVERWLSRLTPHVVAVSKHVHQVMINDIGIAPKRVALVHNGVNTGRFAPNSVTRMVMREALGLGKDDVAIGIIARLAPVKNHALLLRAFAHVLQTQKNRAHLMVIGDGPERAVLMALSAQLGVISHTRFLGERRDTEALLNALDIYALSSLSEGMNLTLLEAMSAGLPIVATAVGGNGEIVQDGITGFLVPVTNVGAMSERLVKLIEDPSLRRQFGMAAREAAIERFDERVMIESYLSLYRTAAT